MVGSQTFGRRNLFHKLPWVELFMKVLYLYRGTEYLLHCFVVMPEHFHLLITPMGSLERAVQCIKGGFSFRAKKELGSNMEIWQKGFSDHRIRDAADLASHIEYIHMNPVRAGLCARPEDYPYSSATCRFELDEVPQRLKPVVLGPVYGAALAAPHQRSSSGQESAAEAAPLQRSSSGQESAAQAAPLQRISSGQKKSARGVAPQRNSSEGKSAEAALLQAGPSPESGDNE